MFNFSVRLIEYLQLQLLFDAMHKLSASSAKAFIALFYKNDKTKTNRY